MISPINKTLRLRHLQSRKICNDSILNIGHSWERYGKYCKITVSKYINGEGTMKAVNVSGEQTGLRCWIKDEGYANIEIEYITNDKGEKVKKYSKDKEKILISYKHRNPSFIDESGKYQITFEKRYRYVEPKYIKGGKFSGKRHEWKEGEHIEQKGLTRHAKKTLKLSSRIMRDLCKAKDTKTNFITLTYGRNVPDDITAKQHLKQFFQRLTRHFGKAFNYIWVAEMQMGKEGSYRDINGAAIHFHILIDKQIKVTTKQREQFKNVYVPPDLIGKRCSSKTKDCFFNMKLDQLKWVNYHWNDIVSKWQSKNNFPVQTITRTDCEMVNDAGKYISKYISKEEKTIIGRMWGIADKTRDLIKPIETTRYELPLKYAEKIMQESIALFYDDYMCKYEINDKGEYKEVKSKNYITVTDKTSLFFSSTNQREIDLYQIRLNECKKELRFNKDVSKIAMLQKNIKINQDNIKALVQIYDTINDNCNPVYNFVPDYPIAWSNNIDILEDNLLNIIEYYDTYKEQRKQIKSLAHYYDF